MSTGFELDVEARDKLGTSETRRLRNQGKVPAILYGGGKDPQSVMLEKDRLQLQMEHEAFYTSILTLNLAGETQAVIVKDVQRHPAKRLVLHLDFQRILEDEEITLNVPIHFLGEEDAIGVKEQGGEISHLMSDVEVSCLPKDLPEYLELDISNLELNQLLHLSDIKVPEGVELTALAHNQDPAVVSINPPRREEEDEALEAEEGLEEGAEPVEGEEPADGETPADSGDGADEDSSG